METLTVGSVVLIPFPFSDLSRSKLRPALVAADAGGKDWILVQITSKPFSDPKAIVINDGDFTSGSLHLKSFVRPAKLFTAEQSLILDTAGILKPDKFREIVAAIVDIFRQAVV